MSAVAGGMRLNRRQLLTTAAASVALAAQPPLPAFAAPGRIAVVGATGATGKQATKALQAKGLDIVAAVRNVAKAEALGVPAVALDVTGDVAAMAEALKGVETVVCCIGFVPGNPFQMGKAAHEVDNLGTQALVDAAVAAGVKRFVLVSSILTNGRAIGQEKSPGFVITNAFGGVLDEKLVAEKHLRASGLEWVIVRPGGLENKPASGAVALSAEDTLYSGTIDRALVGKVLAEAAVAPSSAVNRVVEAVETGTCVEGTCPKDLGPAPADPSKWFA